METLVAIVVLGLLALWLFGGPSNSTPPLCRCGHVKAQHHEGVCREEVEKVVAWAREPGSEEIIATRWELRRCPCTEYCAPQPEKT